MKFNRVCLSLALLSLLFVGGETRAQDEAPPYPFPQSLIERSPFGEPPAPPAVKDNEFFIANAARVSDDNLLTICSVRDSGFKQYVSNEPNKDGFRVVEMFWSDDRCNTRAVIEHASRQYEVGFSDYCDRIVQVGPTPVLEEDDDSADIMTTPSPLWRRGTLNDCAITATEAFTRLVQTGVWTRLLNVALMHEDGTIQGHMVTVWQPFTGSPVFEYDLFLANGTLILSGCKPNAASIIARLNSEPIVKSKGLITFGWFVE